MYSSHLTSTTHTQTLQWFSSIVPSIISIIPEICQKCKYVGPTPDLPSFENQCNSLFHTHAVLSPLIFPPPTCSPLPLASIQLILRFNSSIIIMSSWKPFTTLHTNASVNRVTMALILLLQLFIVPSLTIKILTLFKDLCYLCDRYRMHIYYQPGT